MSNGNRWAMPCLPVQASKRLLGEHLLWGLQVSGRRFLSGTPASELRPHATCSVTGRSFSMSRVSTAAKRLPGGALVGTSAAARSDFPWMLFAQHCHAQPCRVASMRKDKFQNQNCASVFLTNNASLHFANATPDYQARGDIKARAFQIVYRGQQCCAEVRAAQGGRAYYCVCAAHGLRRHSYGDLLRLCLYIGGLITGFWPLHHTRQ